MSKSKRKGMRRAYLKRFSNGYINTGSSPNTQVLSEYSLRGRSLPDPFLVSLFGLDTNKGGQPRVEALELRAKIIQQVDPKRHFKVLETEKLRILLYYQNPKDGFFFVQYEKMSGVVRKSLTYGSKDRAMRILRADKVKWIAKFTAPMNS